MEQELTQARLKELLDYDPATGEFTWKVRRSGPKSKDGLAGWFDKTTGYRRLGVNKKLYYTHQLAFLWMDGKLPDPGLQVDHKNGNRADNRFANLRIVTPSVNAQNLRKSQTNNKSTGVLNVYRSFNLFVVKIWKDGKVVFRKGYDTLTEASIVALEQKRIHHIGNTI